MAGNPAYQPNSGTRSVNQPAYNAFGTERTFKRKTTAKAKPKAKKRKK